MGMIKRMSKQVVNNTVSKSWFCVLNHPEENISECAGKTSKEICEILSKMWCVSDTRSGAWVFCVSAEGLKHVHMVLEDEKAMRFSAVKKVFPIAHIEMTKGNKNQVEDYIYKRGAFEEKGEKIIETLIVGEIKGKQGKRKDLENIKDMVDKGMTPRQILDSDVNLYRLETYINKIYYDEKLKNIPIIRDVAVYWHFGDTGTGKSYQAFEHMQEKGREEVYFCSATNRNPFDGYVSQSEIWIDELRNDSSFFTFPAILSICNGFAIPVSARYQDKHMLWSEVHITTPLMPYEIYSYLDRNDKINQLYRRIRYYVYHYIDDSGKYRTYIYDNRNGRQKIQREFIIMQASFQKKSSETSPNVTEDKNNDIGSGISPNIPGAESQSNWLDDFELIASN